VTGSVGRCDEPWPPGMRAVQITRFGGPEVLDVVDLHDPTPGEGQELFDVSTAGVDYADTHDSMS
jgi:NADPH:quinone reductase-like Zn-dependent oxidoreductase